MNVFISWSGHRSGQLAQLLDGWLPSVIQVLRPFCSPSGIAIGQRWPEEVSRKLQLADFGIVLVSADSTSAPWLLFEAGALSQRCRVAPILFDLSADQLPEPLKQFQALSLTESGIFALLKSLNNELNDKQLRGDILSASFDLHWATLKNGLAQISKSPSVRSEPAPLDARDALNEILAFVRTLHLATDFTAPREFAAVAETLAASVAHLGTLASDAASHELMSAIAQTTSLFHDLVGSISPLLAQRLQARRLSEESLTVVDEMRLVEDLHRQF